MSVTRRKYYYNYSYGFVLARFNNAVLTNTMVIFMGACFSLGKEEAPLYVPRRLVSTWRFI